MFKHAIHTPEKARRLWSIVLAGTMFFSTLVFDYAPAWGAADSSTVKETETPESLVEGLIKENTTPGNYLFYPTPHEIRYTDHMVNLPEEIGVFYEEGVDDYTKDCLNRDLEDNGLSSKVVDTGNVGGATVLLGIYGSGGAVDLMVSGNGGSAALFGKSDAYLLYTTPGKIIILGKDADSVYYGVSTFRQMIEQRHRSGGNQLFGVTVKDYSDIKFRGFIEGYYGNPWSVEDRIDLMKFGGRFKLNRYIFAPKDDPYHNSNWRVLYPEDKLADISRMAQAGNESKCQFTWSIHPFMSSAFDFSSEETYQRDFKIITAKFSQLMEAGVRSFGVLADDAASASAENMIRLLNDLQKWMESKKEVYHDLATSMVFCPSDYAGNGGSSFLKKVNAGFSDQIYIMQTGGKIWGEVTPSFGENFKNNIASNEKEGRYPYMWINWPCTDNSKKHLIMGGYKTFLHTGVKPSTYEGIVLNPMQQSEPSKVAIFGNAEYAWNIWETDAEADKAWSDSFNYVDHLTYEENLASAAFRELSKHMINQNMDGRVSVLQESVELAPKLQAYKEALKNGSGIKEIGSDLTAEFTKLKAAAAIYRSQAGNTKTRDQIVYWLNCWDDTLEAAIELLKGETASENGEKVSVWESYSAAQKAFDRSKTYRFHYVDHYETAEVGVQHIVPFIKSVMEDLAVKVSMILDPTKVVGRYTTNREDTPSGDISYATDGKTSTEIVYKTPNSIEKGTYIGIVYNKPIPIRDIMFEVGRGDNLKDTFTAGKLQYTTDGVEWLDLDGTEYDDSRSVVKAEGLDLTAQGVRLIATAKKGNTWLGVREITINKEEKEEETQVKLIRTPAWKLYAGKEDELFDGNDNSSVWYHTQGDWTEAGDFIGVDLGRDAQLTTVRFVIGAGNGDKWDKYHLEYSSDATSWTTYKSYTSTGVKDIISEDLTGITARYVRMVNDERKKVWVKFSEISVKTKQVTSKYTYTNVEAYKKALTSDGEQADTISLLELTDVTLKPDEYLGLNLQTIKKIKAAEVQTMGGDDLVLQVSPNGREWTDISFSDETDIPRSKYIRLINHTDQDMSFDLTKMWVQMDVKKGIQFLETSMGINEAYGENDSRNTGTLKAMFDGKFSTNTQFCDYPGKGGYITYDLGLSRDIRTIRAYTKDGEKNYLRDGIIQISDDAATWVDVAQVGDGLPNAFGDNQAADGWIHDPKNPGNYYFEGSLEEAVTAKYLRIYFTAENSHRFITFNEIVINEGEYIPENTDARFEATVIEERGHAPQKMIDSDLTTLYRPSGAGSIVYYLDHPAAEQITIIQATHSGASLSARVSNTLKPRNLLTKEDTEWVELGTLDQGLEIFYNKNYKYLYDLKFTWDNDSLPSIYEVMVLDDSSLRPTDSEIAKVLEEAVDQLAGMKEDDYTVDSYRALAEAVNHLYKVYKDNWSGNDEFLAAIKQYKDAYSGLVLCNYYTSKIEITKKPLKTTYTKGEEFEPAGMEVTEYTVASGSNAERKRVLLAEEYSCLYDFSQEGKQPVTVSYYGDNMEGNREEFTASVYVDVTANEYYTAGLEVIKAPKNMVYRVGDEFEPEGMEVVQIQKASGSNAVRKEAVSLEDCEFTYDFTASGKKKVQVSFTGVGIDGEAVMVKAYVHVRVMPGYSGGFAGKPANTYPSYLTEGKWEADAGEWKFLQKDGTYAANKWIYTLWAKKPAWYRFGKDAAMIDGWYADTDGKRYYLHDASDGSRGMMYTGWRQIDEKWYYFNMISDGSLGSLLVSQTTPDGYQVGADGVWIEP